MRKISCTAAIIFILCFIIGCANPRITYTNYEKIEKGWNVDRVTELLGEPNKVKDEGEDYYFKGKHGTIKVEFEHGLVEKKKWKDEDDD